MLEVVVVVVVGVRLKVVFILMNHSRKGIKHISSHLGYTENVFVSRVDNIMALLVHLLVWLFLWKFPKCMFRHIHQIIPQENSV